MPSDLEDHFDDLSEMKRQRPFRKAVFRGLAVLMPPLLTIVLFLWAWNIIVSYVLEPIENTALSILVMNSTIYDEPPEDSVPIQLIPPGGSVPNTANGNGQNTLAAQSTFANDRRAGFVYDNATYVRIKKKYIPEEVYETVEDNPGEVEPTTPQAYYRRYHKLKWLNRTKTVPVFLLGFLLVLYLLGKFLAAGVGRWVWNLIEAMISRVPIISNVYSSVKQVTDFAFSQTELQYTRVVAVQYPRKGCWSIAFVTSEGMLDIRTAANEPVMSVLIPTSPMPATGFTITVPKSETIDLNITIDQAIQFCVSCGVVIPSHQQQSRIGGATIPMPDSSSDIKADTNIEPPKE